MTFDLYLKTARKTLPLAVDQTDLSILKAKDGPHPLITLVLPVLPVCIPHQVGGLLRVVPYAPCTRLVPDFQWEN